MAIAKRESITGIWAERLVGSEGEAHEAESLLFTFHKRGAKTEGFKCLIAHPVSEAHRFLQSWVMTSPTFGQWGGPCLDDDPLMDRAKILKK